MLKQPWFLYTIITVLAWGLWGALIDTPAAAGFPATLGYIVWAITMIPPCLVALARVGWRVETDRWSVLYGCLAGFLGAGGQLVLFMVLRIAPAYLVFPFIALSPLVTILLALAISRERASARGWAGIVLALVAGILLAYTPPGANVVHGLLWVGPALVVFLAWGLQGFVISHGNKSMRAESIFFYMTVTGLLLIPVAWRMTDFSHAINWGFRGPWMAAMIQVLNAVGALLLVYAFRYGRAIIVSPLVNAGGPVVTIILSLVLFRTLPLAPQALGMVAAVLATLLMGMEDEGEKPAQA